METGSSRHDGRACRSDTGGNHEQEHRRQAEALGREYQYGPAEQRRMQLENRPREGGRCDGKQADGGSPGVAPA